MQRRWRQVGCGEAQATPLAKLPACAETATVAAAEARVLKTTPLRSPSARGCGRPARTTPAVRGSPFGSSPLRHAPSALRRARRRETRRLELHPALLGRLGHAVAVLLSLQQRRRHGCRPPPPRASQGARSSHGMLCTSLPPPRSHPETMRYNSALWDNVFAPALAAARRDAISAPPSCLACGGSCPAAHGLGLHRTPPRGWPRQRTANTREGVVASNGSSAGAAEAASPAVCTRRNMRCSSHCCSCCWR